MDAEDNSTAFIFGAMPKDAELAAAKSYVAEIVRRIVKNASVIFSRVLAIFSVLEQQCLTEPVLAGGGVDREQRLVRSVRDLLGDDLPDLAQLVHQVLLGVEAARGVDDHDVG